MELGPEGPEDVGVRHINQHGAEHFGGVLTCSWTPTKGRILTANRALKLGEVILSESPLHIVEEEEKTPAFKKLQELCETHEDAFIYEVLWYWCAIQSLTEDNLKGALVEGCIGTTPEVQRNLLLLHHEEITERSDAAWWVCDEILPNADPIIFDRLVQVWVLNCFEYSDAPQGFSTYFYSSFMSHSCLPNMEWHYEGEDHVLLARRDIEVGEEVCISYLTEAELTQSTPHRRQELKDTKRFWCDCERCQQGIDDMCRGFRCPACNEGVVFAKNPEAGPAKDASLLAEHYYGAICSDCGDSLGRIESAKCAEIEEMMQKLVDKYTNLESAYPVLMKEDEDKIDAYVVQHTLANQVWEQMILHYEANEEYGEQLRLLQRRVFFHKACYPGLSANHGWALESLGDFYVSDHARTELAKAHQKAGKGSSSRKVKKSSTRNLQLAKLAFTEALQILLPMFGKENVYVTVVEEKLAKLNTK